MILPTLLRSMEIFCKVSSLRNSLPSRRCFLIVVINLNLISRAASVVTPIHIYIDKKQEELRGSLKIGTTSKGIGPELYFS